VERHRALGFRCLVCGGPRIAIDVQGVSLGESTNRALESAGREHTKHAMLTAGGWVLAGMGALALVVASVVSLAAAPGAVASLAALLGASVPLGAGVWALARAASSRRLRDDALHRARVAALANVQAVTGLLDGPRIAEAMRLDVDEAELLSAEASVATLLQEAPAPRLRVAPAAPPADLPEDAAEARATGSPKRDTELGS
jgi:hypothetical protein